MKLSVRKVAVAGVLGAVSLVLGYVPALGLIPVPTPAGHATILHVPAILAGVAEGPVVGLLVGLIFGTISLLQATTPAFADPLIAILPRLFIGVFAAWTFMGLKRLPLSARLVVSAIVGTATNTILVLGMMVLRGFLAAKVAVGVGLLHGIPEAVVAAIVVLAVGAALARAGLIGRDSAKKPAA